MAKFKIDGGILLEDGVEVVGQTSPTRRSKTTCWTLSPNPSELYRGSTYQFVVCCEEGDKSPVVTTSFIAKNGEPLTIIRFGSWKDPNPCTGFTVEVPDMATSFEIVGVCRNNVTGETCSNKITIPCVSR